MLRPVSASAMKLKDTIQWFARSNSVKRWMRRPDRPARYGFSRRGIGTVPALRFLTAGARSSARMAARCLA
jgi:hypothetical protein